MSGRVVLPMVTTSLVVARVSLASILVLPLVGGLPVRHVMRRVGVPGMLARVVLHASRTHGRWHSTMHVHVTMLHGMHMAIIWHIPLGLVFFIVVVLVDGVHTVLLISFPLVVLLLFSRKLLKT